MNDLKKCLYYLVRADGGLGPQEKDEYFEDALAHLRKTTNISMRNVEWRALISAASRRNRLAELDKIMG